jgi:hypothetical protein
MAAQLICVEDHESNPQVVACEQWLLGVELCRFSAPAQNDHFGKADIGEPGLIPANSSRSSTFKN